LKSDSYKKFIEDVFEKKIRSERILNPLVLKSVEETFDKVLSYYQMTTILIDSDIRDSILHIIKVNDEEMLVKSMGVLLPLFTYFPLNLYRNLKVKTITFCGEIQAVKEGSS
jgi:hypothetical protein